MSTKIGTNGITLPSYTTTERDALTGITEGSLIYNETIGYVQQYISTGWASIAPPPTVSSTDVTNIDEADSSQVIVITGTGFDTGATAVLIDGGGTTRTPTTSVKNSSTQITITYSGGDTLSSSISEPLDVKVTNGSGLAATLEDAINIDATPIWSTSSGSILTAYDEYSSSSATVAAADPEGETVSYSIASGAVPSGMSLNGSTGAISGTPSGVSSATTSNFSIAASDGTGNSINRSFSILINPTKDGTSSARAAASALDVIENIRAAGGSSSDWQALEGALWINPGFAYGSAFQVYCDMTTQGGGWTLAGKFDNGYRTSTLYHFDANGCRGYSNTGDLDTLARTGNLIAYLDMRDIIAYDRTKTYNGSQFGGKFMMHACTSNVTNPTSSSYDGGNIGSSVSGSAVSVTGGNTISFSPLFSEFYHRFTDGSSNNQYLWDASQSWVTNNNAGVADPGSYINTQSSSDNATWGGGFMNGLGTDPRSPNRSMETSGWHENNSGGGGIIVRSDRDDGKSHFTNVNREGSIYHSGSDPSGGSLSGHTSPKVNWAWPSRDGSTQSYGMGDWTIGTSCSSSTGSNRDVTYALNYLFIR